MHVQINLLVWLLVVAIRDKDFAWEGYYLSTLGDNTMLLGNFINGFTQKQTTSIHQLSIYHVLSATWSSPFDVESKTQHYQVL